MIMYKSIRDRIEYLIKFRRDRNPPDTVIVPDVLRTGMSVVVWTFSSGPVNAKCMNAVKKTASTIKNP